jgi:hypothetical protein
MSTNTVYHGWFSQKQKDMSSRNILSYIYLNEEGKEVEVTEINSNLITEQHNKLFSDSKYMGVVVKFVRHMFLKTV